MSNKGRVKDEKLELLKKECGVRELAFKHEKDPSQSLEQIERYLGDVLNDEFGEAQHVEFFLSQMLPKFITALLRRTDLAEGVPPRVNQFFQLVIEFAIRTFTTIDSPDLVECVCRIFTPDAQFFSKYSEDVEDMDLYEPKEEKSNGEEDVQIVEQSDVSSYFASNVNLFMKKNGFKAMFERMSNPNPKVMLLSMKLFLRIVVKLREMISHSFLQTYVLALEPLVFQHILDLTDEELKNEDRKTISEITSYMECLMRMIHPANTSETIEKFNLQVSYKCFKSPYLEKRLVGLNDIKEICGNVWRKNEYIRKLQAKETHTDPMLESIWMTPNYLADWIKENQILEQLYGNAHAELMKRSGDILKFMSYFEALDQKYLDLLWDTSLNKHESIIYIVYGIVTDVAPYLSPTNIDYVYEKIKAIPYSKYDSQTVILVTGFSYHAINMTMNQKKKKWYGLEIFWDLLQDEVEAPQDIVFQALQAFTDFLQWPPCHSQRVQYMQQCIFNLQQGKSLPQCLRLLMNIIGTYPNKPKKPQQATDTTGSVIEWLNSTHNLLDIFFKELVNYKNIATTASLKLQGVDLNNYVFVGRHPHLYQVKERLQFLEVVLQQSTLTLTVEQLETFWNCVVAHALTRDEQDSGFQWLETVRVPSKPSPPFSDEATQYLFVQKVQQLDLSELSSSGYRFFEFYLRYVNWKNSKLEWDGDSRISLQSFDLIGLDTLWRIALEAHDPTVGKDAIKCLTSFHKNLSPELKASLGQQREEFIKRCMNYLTEAASSQSLSPQAQLRINRCMEILKTFLDEFEIKIGIGSKKHGGTGGETPMTIKVNTIGGPPPFELELLSSDTIGVLRQKAADKIEHPSHLVRIIAAGRELVNDNETLIQARLSHQHVIYITRRVSPPTQQQDSRPKPKPKQPEPVNDQTILPSQILSKQEYFDQLFQLLNNEDIAQQVWELLMLLPTNENMFNEIFTLQNKPNWDQLLDSRSIFKLLYSLQIVDSLLQTPDTDSQEKILEKLEWRQKFLSGGGLNHLYKVLMTTNFYDRSKGSKRKICLSLLLKITNMFTLGDQIQSSSNKNNNDPPITVPTLDMQLLASCVDPLALIPKLMEISWYAAVPFPDSVQIIAPFTPVTQITTSPEEDDAVVVGHVMKMLVACCLAHTDLLKQMLGHPSIDIWLSHVLLLTPEKQLRSHVAAGIYQICKHVTQMELGEYLPHRFFLNKLLVFLPSIQPNLQTCEQYFELLNKLIADSCNGVAGGKPSDFTQLLEQLVMMIKQHPIVETRDLKIEDSVLTGLINIVHTLVTKNDSFKLDVGSSSRGGLIQELFYKCLFEIPTAENHGPLAPPKCKTKPSRRAAFKLLTALCSNCVENFKELTDELLKQHPLDEKRNNWHYVPSAYEKSSTGYVGLKNLGATCYMNSLMQQFYMIPEFRYKLLSVFSESETEDKERKENLKDNMLYQLQTMLSNLQESEKRFFDTKDFCKSYKPDGQPVNPTIQMDADEFFNMLFDKLEQLLKESKQDVLLKDFFGGSLCNQIISKECPHVSERQETFFTLSLDIKNKKNVLESLDLYVEGDVLEGDNKYFCGTCSKKVDALKRACIQDLPDNLIIHIKRFEFDVEQMKRIKLNDYYEFPMTLNMEPYTKEGLAKKEAKDKSEATPLHPPSHYQYELSGILVHTGTADSGHYYSFIRDRDPKVPASQRKWYEFNDTEVDLFDPQKIGAQCFGGVEQVQQYDNTLGKHVYRTMPKMYSAYMLFYDRVVPEKTPPTLSLTTPQSKLIPKSIFQKIWEENRTFLHEKNIFDPEYFRFLWNVVSLQKSGEVLDYNATISGFDPLFQTIVLGTRFVFVTMSHAKEKTPLKEYCEQLASLYAKHIPACKWFLEHLTKDLTWLKQTTMYCTTSETREILATLIINVMRTLSKYEKTMYLEEEPLPDEMELEQKSNKKSKQETENPLAPKLKGVPRALVIRIMDSIFSFLKEAPNHWHNFAQLFLFAKEFASWGVEERQYLLARRAVAQMIDFYLGENSPYARATQQSRKKMGDKFTTPNIEYMIDFLSIMARSCTTRAATPPPTLIQPALQMSDTDRELLYSEPFWSRVLKERQNSKASVEVAVHLSWEDEMASQLFLDICTQGINAVDFDGFQPFFDVFTALLALEDSLHSKRITHGMYRLLNVIYANAKYKNATYHSIDYLLKVSQKFPDVRDWLFENKERWIEPYFMANNHESIREKACNLIQSLIPEYPAMSDNQTPPAEHPASVPKETIERMHALLRYLLSLLRTAKNYLKSEIEVGKTSADYEIGWWKLVHYFRLLKWWMRSREEKLIFAEHFNDFINLLIASDGLRLPCDENKKEMVNLWAASFQDCEENVKNIAENEKYSVRLLDFFISISPDVRYRHYNQSALPVFYGIIHTICIHNPKFLEKVMFHQNFTWALKFLYLETPEYTRTANVLFDIAKMCCANAEYRIKTIKLVVASNKIHVTHTNVLKLLDVLLVSLPDCIAFCQENGVEQLSQFIENRQEDEAPEEILTYIIQTSLQLLHRATAWMIDLKLNDDLKTLKNIVLTRWVSKFGLLTAVLAFVKHFAGNEAILKECYCVLFHLAALDQQCLSSLLRDLINSEHHFGVAASQNSQMEVQYPVKSKSETFYEFATRVSQTALLSSDNQVISNGIDLAILVAKDTTNLPVNKLVLELLSSVWKAQHQSSDLLKQNKNLDGLVSLYLTIDNSQLDREDCHEFVSTVLPTVTARMSDDTKSKLLSIMGLRLKQSVEDMKKATEGGDVKAADAFSSAIHALKALKLFATGELQKEFLKDGATDLASLSELAKQQIFSTESRTEEMTKLIQELTK